MDGEKAGGITGESKVFLNNQLLFSSYDNRSLGFTIAGIEIVPAQSVLIFQDKFGSANMSGHCVGVALMRCVVVVVHQNRKRLRAKDRG